MKMSYLWILIAAIILACTALFLFGMYIGLNWKKRDNSRTVSVQALDIASAPENTDKPTPPPLNSQTNISMETDGSPTQIKPTVSWNKDGPTVSQNGLVTLSFGQHTQTDDIEVRFTDIVHDGRCPENADCAVAGEAVAELTVRKNGSEETVYLSTLTGGMPNYWGSIPSSIPSTSEQRAALDKTVYVPHGSRYHGTAASLFGHTLYLDDLKPNRIIESGKIESVADNSYQLVLEIKKHSTE